MRVALDTNILVYAEGLNGASMRKSALNLLERLPQNSVVLPVQVLGELFQVLVHKANRKPQFARAALLGWSNAYALSETSPSVILGAADLAVQQFNFWDAVILSSAAESDCRVLLSEDMQSGFVWKGVTIINPFAKARHPLLEALLNQPN